MLWIFTVIVAVLAVIGLYYLVAVVASRFFGRERYAVAVMCDNLELTVLLAEIRAAGLISEQRPKYGELPIACFGKVPDEETLIVLQKLEIPVFVPIK